jgi:hypothetical protein
VNVDPYFALSAYGGIKKPGTGQHGHYSVYPYRKLILDSMNHYVSLDGGDPSTAADDTPVSLWELVSRKDLILQYVDLSEYLQCDTLDAYTQNLFDDLKTSEEVPPDLQWVLFRAIYSGLKDGVHRRIMDSTNCVPLQTYTSFQRLDGSQEL